MASKEWFSVDVDGLRKILERRGKQFAIYELVQNCWDENSSTVNITFVKTDPGKATLTVSDDSPEGFRDLTEAYRLFAESYKKANPEQRGAFNVGEKFVLALCSEATIVTTTGGLLFNDTGRHRLRQKTVTGSYFTGTLRCNNSEAEEIGNAVWLLIPPPNKKTFYNGLEIRRPVLLSQFEATLPTVISDETGALRPTSRKTVVEVFECRPGDSPMLYEMGIPVVNIEDKWHVNILQKVPLNVDRDNVTPAYLRSVRVAVLNQMHDSLSKADAAQTWVREAAGDPRTTAEAIAQVMDLRFGEKRVAFDPSDPEANSLAVSKGYTVVNGGSLSAEEWANAKRFETILPAGQVTPSPKPFSEDGKPLVTIPRERWSKDMLWFDKFLRWLSGVVLSRTVGLEIADDYAWRFNACYGGGMLIVNLNRVGHSFFEGRATEKQLKLIVHELAHEYAANHLSEDYYKALCKVGARIAVAALEWPECFAGSAEFTMPAI